MFSKQEFVRICKIEHSLIRTQTDGLSTADTFIQPQPSGNCMNWVLGHLLDNQIILLETLGAKSPVDAADVEIYRRDSNPVGADAPGVLSLERLLAEHDRVHAALVACLEDTDETEFAREINYNERKVTLGWRVLFLNFHYTYHAGQLELLRQLAGRSDKLI